MPAEYMTEGLPDFHKFHKIQRMMRDFVFTEKIDGSNGCIHVSEDGKILAGSRNGWLTDKDNFGFKEWVTQNSDELILLGPGNHYGEWWGRGINRNYGLQDRKFTLFNPHRYDVAKLPTCVSGVIPVLWIGPIAMASMVIERLQESGSRVAPGFMNPEGIVAQHISGGERFKFTFGSDGAKGGVCDYGNHFQPLNWNEEKSDGLSTTSEATV